MRRGFDLRLQSIQLPLEVLFPLSCMLQLLRSYPRLGEGDTGVTGGLFALLESAPCRGRRHLHALPRLFGLRPRLLSLGMLTLRSLEIRFRIQQRSFGLVLAALVLADDLPGRYGGISGGEGFLAPLRAE